MFILNVFKCLSDEVRFRIIHLLSNSSLTVNELLYVIGGNQSNISHHLKVLALNNLVEFKKEGSLIYYRLSKFYSKLNHNGWINNIFSDQTLVGSKIENDRKKLEIIYEKRKNFAKNYFENLQKNNEEYMSFLEKLVSKEEIERLIDNKYEKLVDLGCGNGRNLPLLSKFAKQIIGVDSSEKMLQLSKHICETNNLNYKLELSDINQLTFDNSSIDAIFLNMVLHHMALPEKTIKEINRVLKNGGDFYLVDFLEHNDESLRNSQGDFWLGFSKEDIENWLNENSFTIEKNEIKKINKYDIFFIKAKKNIFK